MFCKYWNLSHTNTLGEGEGGGSAGLRVVKIGHCVPAVLRMAFREALMGIIREAAIVNKDVYNLYKCSAQVLHICATPMHLFLICFMHCIEDVAAI